MTVQLGEDLEITICGRTYHFVRSLETLRRVEAVVGAAAPWAERLEHQGRLQEIVRVYAALIEPLAGGPAAPSELELEEWVFKKGLHSHGDLAVFVYSLTMGRDEIDRVRRWKANRAANRAVGGGQHA